MCQLQRGDEKCVTYKFSSFYDTTCQNIHNSNNLESGITVWVSVKMNKNVKELVSWHLFLFIGLMQNTHWLKDNEFHFHHNIWFIITYDSHCGSLITILYSTMSFIAYCRQSLYIINRLCLHCCFHYCSFNTHCVQESICLHLVQHRSQITVDASPRAIMRSVWSHFISLLSHMWVYII